MEEEGYLRLVGRTLDGEKKKTRNGMTRSIFGERLEFDLSEDHFPRLTTKFVSFKNVFYELMFFLRGETSTDYLKEHGVKIWDSNASREFLDSRGLDYEEGTLGPIYGHQWRHFNAEYRGPNEDYSGRGLDQIEYCIDLIRKDPNSRRILFSAWNPEQLDEMSLPPCHISFQFYVREGVYLDGHLYQRSADVMLGVPYNILSYSLLLHMVAGLTNLVPGKLILSFGDVHIYEEHVGGALEQLERIPSEFPIILMSTSTRTSITDYKYEDFKIENYNHQGKINMNMIA